MSEEDAAWTAMVANCHRWASKHMDQWEKFKFRTQFGTIYVTISRQDQYPDDFNEVDMIGRRAGADLRLTDEGDGG